jgi:hypothetical protein
MIECDRFRYIRVRLSPCRQTQRHTIRARSIRIIMTVFFLCCCSIRLVPASQTVPYQDLLEIIQSPDITSAEFPSVPWRKSSAAALLSYCKSALIRVPHNPLSVGITEDGAMDISDMRIEFARWQLETIFSNCTALTQTILDARSVQQEISVWIELTRLLEDDQTALNLIVSAGMLQPSRDGSYEDNIFGIANWRTVRVVIFEAILKLLAKS